MGIQLNSQPFCRWCGIAIRKRTETTYFGRRSTEITRYSTTRIEKPASLADAQCLVNRKIVSNTRSMDRTYVDKVTTWDGETYEDELFCSLKCEAALGRFVAKHHGWSTNEYRQAKEKGKSND